MKNLERLRRKVAADCSLSRAALRAGAPWKGAKDRQPRG